MRRVARSRLAGLSVLLTLPLLSGRPAAAALTEGAQLAAIYDTILAAQFDRVDAQLRAACPAAPTEACRTLALVSSWWQININPENHELDKPFNDAAASVTAANDAWTKREPRRAEAWFYVAGAYAPIVQWRILRGQKLAAAREGGKIKSALERALKLDPTLTDAYFGLGLYHYYAAVAPAYAKFLRVFLLLPGGNREQGLHEMLTARDGGQLLTGEADYQLHFVYLWYEKQPAEALALLQSLDSRYPSNPLFLQRIAEVQEAIFHDSRASAAAWHELLDRALAERVYLPAVTEARARRALERLR
jgi:hypothetical protein